MPGTQARLGAPVCMERLLGHLRLVISRLQRFQNPTPAPVHFLMLQPLKTVILPRAAKTGSS